MIPLEKLQKIIDNFAVCGKIQWICKDIAETKQDARHTSEREPVKALGGPLQATSSVARDDRDGSSRYRASKMSGYRTN